MVCVCWWDDNRANQSRWGDAEGAQGDFWTEMADVISASL